MSEYMNYSDTFRGLSDLSSNVLDAVVNHYITAINNDLEKEFNTLHQEGLEAYVKQQQTAQEAINKNVEESKQRYESALRNGDADDISKYREEYERNSQKAEIINNNLESATSDTTRVTYTFENVLELDKAAFDFSDTDVGSAYGGHYVTCIADDCVAGKNVYTLSICKGDQEAFEEYLKNQDIMASVYTPDATYQFRNETYRPGIDNREKLDRDGNKNARDWASAGIIDPITQSIYESDAGGSIRTIKQGREFLNALTHTEDYGYRKLYKEEDIALREIDNFNATGEASANVIHFQELNKQYGIDILDNSLSDENKIDKLFEMRQAIVENHMSDMVFNSIGVVQFDKMDESQFTESEWKFLEKFNGTDYKNYVTGAFDRIKHSGLGNMFLRKMASTGGLRFVTDVHHLYTRTKQVYKIVKQTKRVFDETAMYRVRKIEIRRKKKNPDKLSVKPLSKAQKEFLDREREKRKKKEKKKKSTHGLRDRFSKNTRLGRFISQQRLNRSNVKMQRHRAWQKTKEHLWARFAAKHSKIANMLSGTKALKRFIVKHINLLDVALKKVKLALLSAFGWAAGGVLIILIIAVVLTTIGSLLDKNEYKMTAGWHIIENLQKSEEKWVEKLGDAPVLYSQRNKITYGENYQDFNAYISSTMSNGEVRNGDLYINPFDFEPKDANVEKKITTYEDTEVHVTPAGKSSHTSNIKDIICMADVLYDMDMTDSSDDKIEKKQKKDKSAITENVVWNGAKDYINGFTLSFKLIGSVFGVYELSEEDIPFVGNNLTYGRLLAYCYGLFDISHQEQVDLEAVVYPIAGDSKPIVTGKNAKPIDTPSEDDVCPGGEWGCATYDGFVYRDLGDVGYKLCLEDVNGEFHTIGQVKLKPSEDKACILMRFDSNPEFGWNYIDSNPDIVNCWKENTYEPYEESCGSDASSSVEYTFDRGSHTLTKIEYGGAEKDNDGTPSIPDNPETPEDDSVAGTPATYKRTVHRTDRVWECVGHKGHYCGGHIKAESTGLVYTFDDNQTKCMDDEYADKHIELVPKLKKVDYSTVASAKNSGLNINTIGSYWAMTSSVKDVPSNIKKCEDIFDMDMLIDYGKITFPYTNFRNFKSWDADNMQIALLKYSQDWEELYGFDISTNIGCGSLTSKDVKKIIEGLEKHYGDSFNETRHEAVKKALESVGAAFYSQDHHGHGFMGIDGSGHKCNGTDCSGFASYILFGLKQKGGNVCTTLDFAGSPYNGGAFDKGSALPGDVFNDRQGSEGHALVFIGIVDEEIELSSGDVVAPNFALACDCTDPGDGGNIYFDCSPTCSAINRNQVNGGGYGVVNIVRFNDSRSPEEYLSLFDD